MEKFSRIYHNFTQIYTGMNILCELQVQLKTLIKICCMEEEVEYEYSSGCETYEDYCQGGYHPVYLGQKINGKYTVIQKLGWGHFSTVWLTETENPKEQFALKVQRSKESHAETALDEIQLLKKLRQHEEDKDWVSLVDDGFHVEKLKSIYNNADLHKIFRPLLLYDTFPIYGMHGKHYCSVFQVMGPNLLQVIQHFQYKHIIMPIQLAKKITRDVLIQLIYLHDFVHMIHTDLKPENVLLKLNQEDQEKFVECLRNYKVKPISMKFLYKTQTKNPAKNKHKYDKKKMKKKAAKEAQKGKGDMEEEEEEEEEASKQTTKEESQKIVEETVKTENTEPRTAETKTAQQKPTEPRKQPEVKPVPAQKKPQKQDHGNSADSEPDDSSKAQLPPAQQPKKKKKRNRKKKTKKSTQPPIKKNSKQSSSGSYQDEYSDQSDRGRNRDDSSDYSSSQVSSQQKTYTKQQINTLKWKNISIDLRRELHFKICDYGNATMQDKHFTENIQTREYRSPEVIIGHPYLPNTDIWSLACMVYEMLTNTFLFKPKERKSISKDQDHLYMMMELLGVFPKSFLQAGEDSREFFTKKGDLVNGNPKMGLTIGRMLQEDFDYTAEEAKQIEEFLLPMLQYDPAKRINARECLKNKWLWS